MKGVFDLWVYLSASPLLWLTATIVSFLGAIHIAERLRNNPVVNAVLVTTVLLVTMLAATDTSYAQYFEGARFIHVLLGPATVALALPLHASMGHLRRTVVPMLGALLAGSVTAIASAVLIMYLVGAPHEVVASIAPKSTTAPIAMELARNLGGLPSLAAVLVILTGILGAVVVTPLMNALRITDYAARGFAVGIASHGIGTARAFQVSQLAGAFASTAMALNGIFTALVTLLWTIF